MVVYVMHVHPHHTRTRGNCRLSLAQIALNHLTAAALMHANPMTPAIYLHKVLMVHVIKIKGGWPKVSHHVRGKPGVNVVRTQELHELQLACGEQALAGLLPLLL
jgi:hypothetical protein